VKLILAIFFQQFPFIFFYGNLKGRGWDNGSFII